MGLVINSHDNIMYGYIYMAEVGEIDEAKADKGNTRAEVHPKITIKVAKEQLNDDQKQQLGKVVENFEDECLMKFSMVGRGGKVIQIIVFPRHHILPSLKMLPSSRRCSTWSCSMP